MNDKAGSAALAGLVGHYGSGDSSGGESDDESGSGSYVNRSSVWSMCVDPATGCPYYWNQITNEVSWEPPVGYSTAPPLPVALKVVNVSTAPKLKSAIKSSSLQRHKEMQNANNPKPPKKPNPPSSDEDEKIELITSYYHSDSGSGEENTEDAAKVSKSAKSKDASRKQKTENSTILKYGPELPKDFIKSNSNATKCNEVPAATDSKPNLVNTAKVEVGNFKIDKEQETALIENNLTITGIIDKNDKNSDEEKNNKKEADLVNNKGPVLETENLHELMATQANLLKKLGKLGPNDIKFLNGSSGNSPIMSSRTQSPLGSPLTGIDSPSLKKSTALDMDVDDLIAQIEMEQPIDQPSLTSDAQSTETVQSQDGSATVKSTATEDSTESKNDNTFKPLFPSASFTKSEQANENSEKATDLLEISSINGSSDVKNEITSEQKVINKYDTSICSEGIENSAFKRKRRIALDILPVNKLMKPDNPMLSLSFSRYGNNYGVSGERKGLGFKQDGDSEMQAENSRLMYANFKKGESILFQKGDVLNPNENASNGVNKDVNERKETDESSESLNEKKDLIEAKLKFLTQSLPPVPPVQQLFIELQTLWGALAAGALQTKYMDEWLHTADSTLGRLEASAAPHPWICRFHSEAACYVYEHGETGKWQWEYPEPDAPPPPSSPPPVKPPAPPSPPPDEPTDMDISTTPPPQSHNELRSNYGEDTEPLPPGVETPVNRSSPHLDNGDRAINSQIDKPDVPSSENLCAELDSFYSDLAALDEPKEPVIEVPNIETKKEVPKVEIIKKLPPVKQIEPPISKDKKKKIKVKTPSISMKNKTVSSLVAKWKKVQESLDD